MNQAIQMSTIENGPTSGWLLPDTYAQPEKFWEKYFAPYIKTSRTEKGTIMTVPIIGSGVERDCCIIYFPDGTSLLLYAVAAVDFVYDVNGSNGPNEYGIDRFDFLLNRQTGEFTGYNYMGYVDSDEYTIDALDRENILKLCANRNAQYCSQLLFLDNWEFKEDYPFKL